MISDPVRPDVPEAITFGKDRETATEHAKEALMLALAMYVESGKPLPSPGSSKSSAISRLEALRP